MSNVRLLYKERKIIKRKKKKIERYKYKIESMNKEGETAEERKQQNSCYK